MQCKFCGHEINGDVKYCSNCGKQQVIQIENRDALVRRANKMVEDFNLYPVMPSGDLSLDFIERVFVFNPLFVLDDLKKQVMLVLLETTEYRYDEELLLPILEETYGRQKIKHAERIMNTLVNNYKEDAKRFRYKYSYYMDLRQEETLIFYYAYSVYYIAKKLRNASAMLFARTALKALELFVCEEGSVPGFSFSASGYMLKLAEFSEDNKLYQKLLRMIEDDIEGSADEEIKNKLHQVKEEEKKKQANCFIAACVYQSNDCQQVWILRGYRDSFLSRFWLGRALITMYYFISPGMIKLFGNKKRLTAVCKDLLDYVANCLYNHGYSAMPG